MDWTRLLSRQRLGSDKPPSGPTARSEFQQDYDRIVFSSAFRRLQDKTQVVPIAENDYVRTRLTHSLEVSCVGRSLGAAVGQTVLQGGPINGISPHDFGDIVAAACVAHDIGNPPFGHSGEDAIQCWFKEKGTLYLEGLDEQQRMDFLRFEGNAQGFRVITRLQFPHYPGLRLTGAVMGALSKYPRPSNLKKGEGVSEKKYGYFKADQEVFRKLADSLGLNPKKAGGWARHPLAFLVEAADDICYCIVDLEDGYRSDRVSFEEFSELMKGIAFSRNGGKPTATYERIRDDRNKVEYLRANAIGELVVAVANAFWSKVTEILSGELETDLTSNTEFAKPLAAIRDFDRNRVYSAPRVLQIEAAGFEIISGLLSRFVPALVSRDPSAAQLKLLQLLPPLSLAGCTTYERLLLATDFIAGMTDSFAIRMHKRLSGMELPGG